MISLAECKKWDRVNSSIMLSKDGKNWRTSAHGLRQSITAEGKKTYVMPHCIRILGRGVHNYVNPINTYAEKMVKDKDKKIHYENIECDECGLGYFKINSNYEKQCNYCGLILDKKTDYYNIDSSAHYEKGENKWNHNDDKIFGYGKRAMELQLRFERIEKFERTYKKVLVVKNGKRSIWFRSRKG